MSILMSCKHLKENMEGVQYSCPKHALYLDVRLVASICFKKLDLVKPAIIFFYLQTLVSVCNLSD